MADQETRSAARVAALIAVPVALLAGIGLFALLSGALADPAAPDPAGPAATGPVTTGTRDLDEWEETVCRALLAQLPEDLDGLAQRPVTAGPEQNAAYGDPPVTIACGAPEAAYELTDTVYPLPGGVCWHAAEEPDGSVWTTLDRQVPVRVTVPAGYDGPGQWVTALSDPVTGAVPTTDTAPSGCS